MSSIHVNANAGLNDTEKYFGNYIGLVIQNNDPDKGGKIKIWIPQISPTVYKNWDENLFIVYPKLDLHIMM